MKLERSSKAQREAIAIAETTLGKPLPIGAEVHHVDENPLNNKPQNLVICEDRTYHWLLHQRARALKACGHADWLKCRICKKYDDPTNLKIQERQTAGTNIYHQNCISQYTKQYYKGNKEKWRRTPEQEERRQERRRQQKEEQRILKAVNEWLETLAGSNI